MINLGKALVVAALVASATIMPAKAETSFLEAALFFLTGVEPGPADTVTDQEIILRSYPIVAYLVDGKPCAVRIRNRNDHRIWEMDFCKVVGYSFSVNPGPVGGGYWYFDDDSGGNSYKCVFVNGMEPKREPGQLSAEQEKQEPEKPKTVVNENYMGDLIGRGCDLGSGGFAGYTNITKYDRPPDQEKLGRSQERLIASFKYIEWLFTRKPY